MLYILFSFLLIFYQGNCYEISIQDEENIFVDPGLSKTYYLQYQKDTKFVFNIPNDNYIQINIHAVNCFFNIDFKGDTLKSLNKDTYSLNISSSNPNITIKPLLDVAYGQYKENYANKTCPLSMNSYVLNNEQNEPEVKITNQEVSYFYFQPQEYNLLKISYNIKEVTEESYAGLFFQFNEKSNFIINIIYRNEKDKNPRTQEIYNSTTLFLDSTFLLYDPETKIGGYLTINITNLDEKPVLMRFKIIEKDSISLLQKNALNYGFLTSKTPYQYFYTEVFQGEEGELVLHNKRIYGRLYGRIVSKADISTEDLNNISIYPNNKENSSNILDFNYHTLQANFSYLNTSSCLDGCYLLITFEQTLSEGDFPLIGYEFTILTRFWNYTDYISEIVDIPFNEYLIGSFEKGSISHHYYSLFIPDDAEKLIIQIESNYLDGFFGEGRLKINTVKQIGNTEQLNLINDKNILPLEVKKSGSVGKTISFAFRPKDYFSDIFSYYYFRVLYVKKNETLYYPIDSNLGNLCLPEYNNDTHKYYCHLKYSNEYNELSRKFAIASAILNEFYIINATKYFKDGTNETTSKQFVYPYLDIIENIDYYLFTFEFPNGELKNILTTASDNVLDIYPQIYSYQMFFIMSSYKMNHFQMIKNYTFYYQYVYGFTGNVSISVLNYQKFVSSRNFRGKPFSVSISSETDNVNISSINPNFVYYIKLQYNMKNKVVEEIKSGETYSQFIIGRNFPLYFYFKIKNKDYINVDINLRINSFISEVIQNNFDIYGYVLDEDTIQRKINGEFIQLNNAIPGYYSNSFKVGLLQVNQANDNNKDYILIEVRSGNKNYIDSYLLVQLVTKEYNNDIYFLLINQYVIETFDDKNGKIRPENKYYLSIEEKNDGQGLIDFSPNYPDIYIDFDESANVNSTFFYQSGFNKHRVYSANNDNVYFSVKNPNMRKNANYMIRYYYTGIGGEYNYTVDDDNRKINISMINNEYANISITYNSIKIVSGIIPEEVEREDIYFYIYAFLFKKDINLTEQLNTTSMLHDKKYSYKANATHYYHYSNKEKWKLTFENVKRSDNYKYELQLQINAILPNNIFNEEFLVYKSEIDLTDIKYEDKSYLTWVIVGSVLGVIVIGLVIFFVVKYTRLQKSNVDLKEEMKSMAYSNDVQKNVLIKEQKSSQKESDYESTFI